MLTADDHILRLLTSVHDPEIPVLSIMDMGIVREIEEKEGVYHISITPTYSGCPAMNTIESERFTIC